MQQCPPPSSPQYNTRALTIRSHRRHGALAQRLPLGDALRARQRLATVALELAHQHRLRAAGRRLAGNELAQSAAGQHGSSGAAQMGGAHDETGQHHSDDVSVSCGKWARNGENTY